MQRVDTFLHEADPCRPRNRTDVEEVETEGSSTVPLSWTRRGRKEEGEEEEEEEEGRVG